MSDRRPNTFASDFRVFFFKGLGILLPTVITLAILAWAFGFLRNNIAEPINAAVRAGVIYIVPQAGNFEETAPEELPAWYRVTPEELTTAALEASDDPADLSEARTAALRSSIRRESFRDYWNSHWYLQGIGFVVAVIAVYLAGVFVGNYLGKRVYHRLESFFVRIPVIKQVYPNVKQIIDFLLGNEDQAMPASGKVILLEWPRHGAWTVGLMTGESMRDIEAVVGEECVTVFIPNSPTPFTGFTVNVPRSHTRETDLTMDEAIRFVVSGGVLVPERQRTPHDHSLTERPTPTLPPDTETDQA